MKPRITRDCPTVFVAGDYLRAFEPFGPKTHSGDATDAHSDALSGRFLWGPDPGLKPWAIPCRHFMAIYPAHPPSSTPMLQYPNAPLLHYSITPILRYSMTHPLFSLPPVPPGDIVWCRPRALPDPGSSSLWARSGMAARDPTGHLLC
jgi:hypothetical protein